MTNDDEMKKPKIRFDSKVDKAMAKVYEQELTSDLHTLLADKQLIQDLDDLRIKYGIKPREAIDDEYTDMQIAEAVHNSLKYPYPKNEEERLQYFVNAITIFGNDLDSLMKKHDIDAAKWKRFLKMYIAYGKIYVGSSLKGIIRTELDPKTKELTLHISPKARRKDLEVVWGTIYEAWQKFLPKQDKYQPAFLAKRDAEIVRYKQQGHSHKETATKFGLEVDNVKQIIRRQIAKRQDLK